MSREIDHVREYVGMHKIAHDNELVVEALNALKQPNPIDEPSPVLTTPTVHPPNEEIPKIPEPISVPVQPEPVHVQPEPVSVHPEPTPVKIPEPIVSKPDPPKEKTPIKEKPKNGQSPTVSPVTTPDRSPQLAHRPNVRLKKSSVAVQANEKKGCLSVLSVYCFTWKVL